MRRQLLLGSVVWLALSAGTVFAYVTDENIYSPVNYFQFLPPEIGQSYIDPAFGTMITRISNAPSQPHNADTGNLAFIVNEYATMTPFNNDTSRILLQHQSYFALYDGAGHYLKDLSFEINASSEPRWSRRDSNVLFYTAGGKLKEFNVVTDVTSLVHTFTEYTTIRGLGESDISFDGDHFVLVGDSRHIFVYEISSDAKGPVFDAAGLGGFDNVYITPSNNVLVSWHAKGTGRYQGVELYDRNMNFLRQVTRAMGHMDVTRDTTGEEVLLWINAGDPNPPANCQNGIMKIRLADAYQTCLMSLDWSLAVHISAPDDGDSFFVSTHAQSDPSALGGWKKYTNEILQVKLDGSEVRRLVHHRSRPFNSYWWTPRVSVSRDASKLASIYAISGLPAGPHTLTIEVTGSKNPASGGAWVWVDAFESRARVEQDNPAVSYSCPPYLTWHLNTYSGHSGAGAALAMNGGCQAAFDFTGTAVGWVAYRDQWSGIARVYIDGAVRAEIDTYASPQRAQASIYAITGLPAGSHTLTIEVTGSKNPASGGTWVWVDAFETPP